MVSRRTQEEDEKKRNCWHKLCFELFLNNKLRIYVFVGEGFMTNLFFYYGAVSLLLRIFMSVNNYYARHSSVSARRSL